MTYFLIYLIKSTVYLGLFYAFFMIAMRRTTFFRFNRLMLLVGTFVCMLLPCHTITVEEVEGMQLPIQMLDEILVLAPLAEGTELMNETTLSVQKMESTPTAHRLPYLLIGVYVLGAVIYLIMVIRSFVGIWKLMASHPKQWKDGCWLIVLPEKISSFSWSNYIVISEEDYRNYPQVMVHERMHYECRHSYDILFMTIVHTLHWFNPMVWLIRTELKQLHEFEADEGVINQGIDATQYQLLLVKKAVGKKLYTMANGFNHTKLQKRITMMNQEKSNGWERLKWLVTVPVVMGAMLVFAQPEVKNGLEEIIPSENVQEEPKDWESLRKFFIEKSTPYRKYLIEQGNDVKGIDDKRLTIFRVNKRNEILVSDCYDLKAKDSHFLNSNEIRPYIVQSMREARNKRKEELGKDEVRGIVFDHDMSANSDSLYSYLRQIKWAYEDLRKDYSDDENLDKICPMWVHFLIPRNYSKKSEMFSGKVDVFILDSKDGTIVSSVKKIKQINQLRRALSILPNNLVFEVSIKADKDTPMGEITEIKSVLRGYYSYSHKMNMEMNDIPQSATHVLEKTVSKKK